MPGYLFGVFKQNIQALKLLFGAIEPKIIL